MKIIAQPVRQFLRGLLLAGVALVLLVPVEFATASTQTAPKHVTPYWQISSVNVAGSTIELQKSDNSSNLVLKVTGGTRITINNKTAKFSDLQGGMKVQSLNVSGNLCSSLSIKK